MKKSQKSSKSNHKPFEGLELIKVLYRYEINASISWFYDGGFNFQLGDDYNGREPQSCGYKSIDECIAALWEAAKKKYPKIEWEEI